MVNRKEQLFQAKQQTSTPNVIPATVKFRHNKVQGTIEELSAQEKMLCALRKCLAEMSQKNTDGCRYYIANNKVQLLSGPTHSPGKKGEPRTYKASGRCKVGVAHAGGHSTSMFIEFSISYRDSEDDRGLADVEFFDPTSIDKIDPNGGPNISALA